LLGGMMRGRPRPGPLSPSRGANITKPVLLFFLVFVSVYIYVLYGLAEQSTSTGSSNSEWSQRLSGGEEKATIFEEEDEDDDDDDESSIEDDVDPILQRKRTIVLSTGKGKWNTGVWPGWGSREVTLNWAAAGVKVERKCRVECEIRHEGEQSGGPIDAVVMELINHPKFGYGRGVPVPWPERQHANPRYQYVSEVAGRRVPPRLPLVGLFYYEAERSYPEFTLRDRSVQQQIDFSMTPSLDSSLPVTLICPWGHPVADYLRPPPPKSSSRFIAHFNEHGIASQFEPIIAELFQAAGESVHRYGPHRSNMQMPAEAGGNPYQLSRRIDFMGTYKFILITEAIEESSFISPEWSHAILSGAVPVYIGAPNIGAFAPGPRSFINIRDFTSGVSLWEFLLKLDHNVAEYQQWFEWKNGARLAYQDDEAVELYPLGTGTGYQVQEIAIEQLQKDVEKWSKPEQSLTGRSQRELNQFQITSVQAWRWFREHLNRCVHYAECRMCELVSELT